MTLDRVCQAFYSTASVLAVAYFVLWACAPTSAFAPAPAPRSGEVGAGLSASTNRIEGVDAFSFLTADTALTLDGQAWLERRFDAVSIGLTFFAGQTSVIGVGGHVRFHLMSNRDMALALEVQGGLGWVALAMPTHLRLSDALMFYTNPSAGLRVIPFQLPVGLSAQAGGVSLSGSVGIESPTPDEAFDRDAWPFVLPDELRLGFGVGGSLD